MELRDVPRFLIDAELSVFLVDFWYNNDIFFILSGNTNLIGKKAKLIRISKGLISLRSRPYGMIRTGLKFRPKP